MFPLMDLHTFMKQSNEGEVTTVFLWYIIIQAGDMMHRKCL